MASDLIGFDLVTLKGNPLSRALAALRIARQQVQLAYDDASGWRVEMALSEAEGAIDLQIAEVQNAVEEDAADAEASGYAAAVRQAWLPLRAA